MARHRVGPRPRESGREVKKLKELFQVFMFRVYVLLHLIQLPRWAIGSFYMALMVGYNELAKQQEKLGQKAICRAMLQIVTRAAQQIGITGPVMLPGNRELLRIEVPDAVYDLVFRESDIELMRDTVARFDACELLTDEKASER